MKHHKKCREVCAKKVTADTVIAKKVLEVPSKCVKINDYSTSNYTRFGPEGRIIGAYEYVLTAPPAAGGRRVGVVSINLGGSITVTSTLLNPNPQIAQRNMFQGEYWITGTNRYTTIIQVLVYNALGQVLGFQVIKGALILTEAANPLLDTLVGSLVVQSYNYVFATAGDPTTSVIGQVKVGPLIPASITFKRLANTEQFIDIKNNFNECN